MLPIVLFFFTSGINTGLKFHISDFLKMGLGDNQPSVPELTKDGWTFARLMVFKWFVTDSSLYTHVYTHSSEAQTIC